MGMFNGCKKLETVYLPETLEQIGDGAFYDCINLRHLQIPPKVSSIGSLSFFNCPKLTIHAPAGSYAEQFAKEHKIPFVAE